MNGLNEMIFTFSRMMARYLGKAIDNLFFDHEWKVIAKKLKSSPFLNSLKKAGETLATVERKVSYPGKPADSSDIRSGIQMPVQTVTGTCHILVDLGIPMGWTKNNMPQVQGKFGMAIVLWLVKIMGILLTAFATSLGAPF